MSYWPMVLLRIVKFTLESSGRQITYLAMVNILDNIFLIKVAQMKSFWVESDAAILFGIFFSY